MIFTEYRKEAKNFNVTNDVQNPYSLFKRYPFAQIRVKFNRPKRQIV